MWQLGCDFQTESYLHANDGKIGKSYLQKEEPYDR